MKLKSKTQTTLEYAAIILVVAAALTAMGVYINRSIKANQKLTQDKVNARPFIPIMYTVSDDDGQGTGDHPPLPSSTPPDPCAQCANIPASSPARQYCYERCHGWQ